MLVLSFVPSQPEVRSAGIAFLKALWAADYRALKLAVERMYGDLCGYACLRAWQNQGPSGAVLFIPPSHVGLMEL